MRQIVCLRPRDALDGAERLPTAVFFKPFEADFRCRDVATSEPDAMASEPPDLSA
ncbi:MAG: hypothetical protein VX589_01665 [Myxococcota bacterium]|nr:hypothetical protein [Myxococcota bacterium]